jgi:hypothetical protein
MTEEECSPFFIFSLTNGIFGTHEQGREGAEKVLFVSHYTFEVTRANGTV